MRKIDHCEPAASLISKFGGLREVAGIAGVSITQVQRWRLPKKNGGTGGAVPHWHHGKFRDAAREREIPLKANDLISMEAAE